MLLADLLHFRFPLSLLHVEDLLCERSIEVSSEAAAKWAAKLIREHVRSIGRRLWRNFADKQRLDEMAVSIKGKKLAMARRSCGVPRPGRRNIGMAFKDHGVYRHLTIFSNISYPLEVGASVAPMLHLDA